MSDYVIALDPGGTTGVATFECWPDGEVKFNIDQIGPEEHHLNLWSLLSRKEPEVVVCESFEFRQGKQRDNLNLVSKEYIGIVKLYCEMYGAKHVAQTAAIGKGFVDDKKLKVMGLWTPGKKHAMDAMRHLVTYLVQKERRTDLIESWKAL